MFNLDIHGIDWSDVQELWDNLREPSDKMIIATLVMACISAHVDSQCTEKEIKRYLQELNVANERVRELESQAKKSRR